MAVSELMGVRRNWKRRILAGAALGLPMVLPSFAWAQDAAEEPEEVIVTGSQIARSGFDTPTPVTVVGTEDFERVAAPNVADALNQYPALKPSVTPEASTNLSKLSSGNYLDLRGLTYLRTLTLVDGKRPTPSSPEGVVNVNNIPQAVISGAEVVTGGASAAYGSDAVAGVVNFKIDHKLEGVRGNAQYGISNYGDNKSYLASAAAGTKFAGGRGHIIVGAEMAQSKGILDYGEREWGDYATIANPASTPTNTAPTFILVNQPRTSNASYGGLINSATGANGTTLLRGIQFLGNGQTGPFNYGTNQTANAHQGGDGVCGICDAVLKQPYKRWAAYGASEFEFDTAATFYASFGYARSDIENAPSITANDQITIQRDNVFLPASIRTILNANPDITSFVMGRAINDYARGYINKVTWNWQAVAGLRGKLGGSWSYDVSYTYGKARDYTNFAGARHTANWRNALDAVDNPATPGVVDPICRSTITNPGNGCVPLNLFGVVAPGTQQAALDYITGDSIRDWQMKQQAADLVVRGSLFSLPGGTVSFAGGVHWRKFEVDVLSDPISASRPGGATVYRVGNTLPFSGTEEVKEAFGELLIPILADQDYAKNLDLNVAGRITDYKTSGQVETWKIGINYAMTDFLRFRGTRSRDIRAPNIQELFAAGQTLIFNINDSARANEVYSVSTTQGGNPFLKPEKADTLTLGMVVSPTRDLRFSLDYYDIKIEGAIAALTAQQIVNRCNNGDAGSCALVTRGPASGSTPGQISGILLAPANFQSIMTAGIDFEASYRTDFWKGSLDLRVLANYVNKLELVGDGGARTILAGTLSQTFVDGVNGSPNLRVTSSASYSTDGWRANLTGRWIGGGLITRDTTVTKPFGTPISDKMHGKGRFYLDLSGEVTLFRPTGGKSKVAAYGSILNLLNTDPPILGYDWATARHLYDVIGRQFTAGIRFSF
ncbi:TonB-dependent receptor [Sphingomonas koreensis]|uniref:TonB-dependent receptor n=1 Tax=Sphingomonas koreensis TaxID=93064 RepID=A0A430G3Z1_9SPHN|nr:TonB-dependent receptor [Sphingomonas koreensis]RSY85889.1 TonB-dependent receptor [Sphingomonas koreensis]